MFKQLKKRLIFMYGITSSLILTLVIICVFYINWKENERNELETLENAIFSYAQNVEKSEYIHTSWLAQIESKHHLLIRIEDNGIDLGIRNTIPSLEDSKNLFKVLRKKVIHNEPYFFDTIYYNEIKLSISYYLYPNRKEHYCGMIANIPSKKGLRMLYAIQVQNPSYQKLFLQGIYLFLLEVAGIFLLFAVSYLYINKVLKPLEVGKAQQKEFIASVSHELRSPLTVIKAGVHSIKSELSVETVAQGNVKKARHYIFPIESECIRMNRLINDMLLLSTAEQDNWTIINENVDLETLLIEVYDTVCILHSKESRTIHIDLSGEPLQRICGDYERLKQVCMILLDNALNYTPADKPVTIRAYNHKPFVNIEVEDHGEGLPAEEKQRVFDPFYRRDLSRNDKNHFGLGLSIAKRLVELHEGSISIQDTAGGGTTFGISLHTI